FNHGLCVPSRPGPPAVVAARARTLGPPVPIAAVGPGGKAGYHEPILPSHGPPLPTPPRDGHRPTAVERAPPLRGPLSVRHTFSLERDARPSSPPPPLARSGA